LNLSRVCRNIMAMVQVTFSDNAGRQTAKKFEHAIEKLPQAVECFKMSGDVDYFVQFICKDNDQLNELTEALLEQDIGIAKLKTDIILAHPKSFLLYPLNELEWLDE